MYLQMVEVSFKMYDLFLMRLLWKSPFLDFVYSNERARDFVITQQRHESILETN